MSDLENILAKAEEILQPWALSLSRPEENRLDVVINAANLPASVEALLDGHWGYLSAVTGLDKPAAPPAEGQDPGEGMIEVLYSFCEGPAVTTLRILIPYSSPVLPTICGLIPSATLYERETIEMFGVVIEGTPDTSRLIVADAWPEGVYPLRKSFIVQKSGTQDEKENGNA
jgi:Ni,Fe-hydrogenase III component G